MAPSAQRILSFSLPLSQLNGIAPPPNGKETTNSDLAKVRFEGHEASQNEWVAPSSEYSSATVERNGTAIAGGDISMLSESLDEEEEEELQRVPLHGLFIIAMYEGEKLIFEGIISRSEVVAKVDNSLRPHPKHDASAPRRRVRYDPHSFRSTRLEGRPRTFGECR